MADPVRVMQHGKVVQIPNSAPMIIEVGVRGVPGAKGEKGDAMTFEDLTPEQKEELRGPKGEKGDSGEVSSIDFSMIDNLF